MPTRPLDRLLFVQGGLCFFCKQPLPRDDASIEHLHAIAKGGANGDDNCVACCKMVNTLLGSMSIKQKFEVVLNQKGHFRCPNTAAKTSSKPLLAPAKPPVVAVARLATSHQASPPKPSVTAPDPKRIDRFALVVANLKTRGNSRPRTLKTLTSSVAALFPKGISQTEVAAIVRHLQATGKVKLEGEKVAYKLQEWDKQGTRPGVSCFQIREIEREKKARVGHPAQCARGGGTIAGTGAEHMGTQAPAVARPERALAAGKHSPSLAPLRRYAQRCGKQLSLQPSPREYGAGGVTLIPLMKPSVCPAATCFEGKRATGLVHSPV